MDGNVSGGRKAGLRGRRGPARVQGGASRAVLGESGMGGPTCSSSGQDIDRLLIQGVGEGQPQKVLYSGWLGRVGEAGAMGTGGETAQGAR